MLGKPHELDLTSCHSARWIRLVLQAMMSLEPRSELVAAWGWALVSLEATDAALNTEGGPAMWLEGIVAKGWLSVWPKGAWNPTNH